MGREICVDHQISKLRTRVGKRLSNPHPAKIGNPMSTFTGTQKIWIKMPKIFFFMMSC